MCQQSRRSHATLSKQSELLQDPIGQEKGSSKPPPVDLEGLERDILDAEVAWSEVLRRKGEIEGAVGLQETAGNTFLRDVATWVSKGRAEGERAALVRRFDEIDAAVAQQAKAVDTLWEYASSCTDWDKVSRVVEQLKELQKSEDESVDQNRVKTLHRRIYDTYDSKMNYRTRLGGPIHKRCDAVLQRLGEGWNALVAGVAFDSQTATQDAIVLALKTTRRDLERLLASIPSRPGTLLSKLDELADGPCTDIRRALQRVDAPELSEALRALDSDIAEQRKKVVEAIESTEGLQEGLASLSALRDDLHEKGGKVGWWPKLKKKLSLSDDSTYAKILKGVDALWDRPESDLEFADRIVLSVQVGPTLKAMAELERLARTWLEDPAHKKSVGKGDAKAVARYGALQELLKRINWNRRALLARDGGRTEEDETYFKRAFASGAVNTVDKVAYGGKMMVLKREEVVIGSDINDVVGIPSVNPRLGNRSVATYAVAQTLGLGVVPETTFATHGGQPGTAMELVSGAAPGAMPWLEIHWLNFGDQTDMMTRAATDSLREVARDPESYAAVCKFKRDPAGRLFRVSSEPWIDHWRRAEGSQASDVRKAVQEAVDVEDLLGQPAEAKARDTLGAYIDELGNAWSRGTFKAKAPPTNPKLQASLLELQVMDAITGQVDRHGNNYFVDSDGEGGFVAKAIDNDLSFGSRMEDPNQFEKEKQIRRMDATVGLPPLVPKKVYDALMDEGARERMKLRLQPLLEPEELAAALKRFDVCVEHMKLLQSKGRVLTEDQFGEHTYLQMCDRKFCDDVGAGRTYLVRDAALLSSDFDHDGTLRNPPPPVDPQPVQEDPLVVQLDPHPKDDAPPQPPKVEVAPEKIPRRTPARLTVDRMLFETDNHQGASTWVKRGKDDPVQGFKLKRSWGVCAAMSTGWIKQQVHASKVGIDPKTLPPEADRITLGVRQTWFARLERIDGSLSKAEFDDMDIPLAGPEARAPSTNWREIVERELPRITGPVTFTMKKGDGGGHMMSLVVGPAVFLLMDPNYGVYAYDDLGQLKEAFIDLLEDTYSRWAGPGKKSGKLGEYAFYPHTTPLAPPVEVQPKVKDPTPWLLDEGWEDSDKDESQEDSEDPELPDGPPWDFLHHGNMTRTVAEKLLAEEGTWLLRYSATTKGWVASRHRVGVDEVDHATLAPDRSWASFAFYVDGLTYVDP